MIAAVLLAALAAPPAPEAAVEQAAVVVAGRVYARGSRDPAVGASLTVDGAGAGETDAAGDFSLTLPPGRHVLQIQQPGFRPATITLDAAAGAPPLVVRLEPN